ncbi:GroES-like protein [Aspergillus saccharolyticus JOP 1030-1]|uniref:GroES-like protein n=1 Tax=Aspergillus saccharolyticus JOP 1030-1 TaxID=1450539 RepID=A0A318ZPP9_9EURO|nr:GroES-like protein [Aspergillus saccharolyticus JOP 1030-1]PYH48514.1 GroES-like protein [Aspergillus saccharolyticus JOP 1030-1]
MSLPATFKQAVFRAAGSPLVIEESPLTPPGDRQLLVKVEACGVCSSDRWAQNNVLGGGFPIVPGHEIIGRIAAVGDGVLNWKVGDRVGGGWHGGHDGTCGACRKGFFQMCSSKQVNGETKNGGYAEYCLLNAEAAVRVPEHVPAAKYAPILCAGVTVFNSLRHMNITPGEIVAVQGLGGLGHLAIQYARKMGYRVVAISRDSRKEAMVRELGAHDYIDESRVNVSEALQQLGGASLIMSTAPNAAIISPLLKGLGVLGKLLILSVPGPVPVDTSIMVSGGLSVQAWPSGHANDSEDAITFTELQDINCMVEEFPLEDANKAYDAMVNGTVRFRAVLTMN